MRLMTAVSPFTDLIEKITVSALSAEMGAPYQTVAAWKQRGSIPPSRWPALISIAKKRDIEITLELLHEWQSTAPKGDA